MHGLYLQKSIPVPLARRELFWRNLLQSRRCVGVEEKERICCVVRYNGKHRLVMTMWPWSFLPHLIDPAKILLAHSLWMRYTFP